MKLAGSFEAATEVAEQNCREWIFVGSGEVFHAEELREVAREYDAKTPLEDDDYLVVTEDGSIGLAFPGLKEPLWYFVSPEWAVANILKDDPEKYMVTVNDGAQVAGPTGAVMNRSAEPAGFCKECGAPLQSGDRFCENCGAKNTPKFCMNCGAKLESGSQFCGNCGTRV